MIRRILYTALLISLSLSLLAQQNKEGKFELGIKGGMNYSTASTHFHKAKSKFGYNAGVALSYYFYDNWSINTGIEYSIKNFDAEYDYPYNYDIENSVFHPSQRVDANYQMGYIQLPITVGYEFLQTKNISLDIHTGLYFAYGTNIKVKEQIVGKLELSDGSSKDINQTIKHKKWDWLDLHQFDFGMIAGTKLKSGRFFLDASYQLAFTNIGNSRENDRKFRNRLKNRNFTLTAGFNFIAK